MLLAEVQNATAALEKSSTVSYKTKHTLTIWSTNQAPWYLPKGAGSMSTQKLPHTCL